MQEHSLRRGRLAVAVGAACAVILSSPFVGDLRSAILAAFPAQFQVIVGGAVAVAVAVALMVALTRIRDRRFWRFAGLAAAIGGAIVYAQAVSTGNVLVDVVERVHFVEYGAVGWLFYLAWRPLDHGAAIVWPMLAGAFTGIADESIQWLVPGRVGEAHDVFIDVVAVGCGLCFAVSADPPARFDLPLRPSVARPVAYGVSAVLLAFAAFFQAVHLGHAVYEPGIGMFWSRYDADALTSASIDRAARWRTTPPGPARPLSREDQYLSEGLWHVQERNRAWGVDDPFTAWRENLILERFYGAVLDMPTGRSRQTARWPQQQRDDTAARLASDPGIYISRAAPYPIYAWPPLAFWSAVVLVIAAVITAC
jgi:VanZ family protein